MNDLKRTADIKRRTGETDITLSLDLDGTGKYKIETECGFMKHMLELFARHGRFDIELKCSGDSEVDFHHTVEDMGIALGQAFSRALGDKRNNKVRQYDAAYGRSAGFDFAGYQRQDVGELPGISRADGGRIRHGTGGGIHNCICQRSRTDHTCRTAGRDQHSPHHRSCVQGHGPGAGKSCRHR